WAHVGQLGASLERVARHARSRGVSLQLDAWHAHLGALKHVHAMSYDRANPRIQPQAVIEAINRHTRGRAIITTGVGQHQMWSAQFFDFAEPRHWLTSGSMGTMGFGLPAAIGAQFAHPGATVIDVDGDGSIRMNIGELETVATYGLPLKIVLLNNHGDGMVRQWQKLFFKSRYSATGKNLHTKDFVRAAQADGIAWARRLEREEELEATVAEFLAAAGPAFLEVVVDPDAGVYPMVGPGASYAQMITGDFIPSRGTPPPGEAEASTTHMF